MRISRNGIELNKISLPRLAWLLVAVVMFWHVCYVTSGEERRDKIILSDGAGYYAYLPAVFIYHDLSYKFCRTDFPEHPDALGADASLFVNHTPEGKEINKYFIGTAILESPFFFVAYAIAAIFGYDADGYSFPFQIAIALAAIFYVLLGLEQVKRLLIKRNVPEYVQAVVILLLFFGTNLYHYALGDPAMSHAFSFAMVALFLNLSHNLFHQQKKNDVLRVALALTAIVMIRPVNGIIVFSFPFIAGSWRSFVTGLRISLGNFRAVAIGLGAFALMVFLQLLVYKLSVNKWFEDSYSGEHIDFTNVHFANVLYSWKRGIFVYTPLMIFALSGVIFFRSNFERIAFLCFFIMVIWVIASWQQWWYGGGLGMRPFVEYYPLMAIPLAAFVYSACRKWKNAFFVPVLGFVVVLNLIQHYQYTIGILPYDGMNFARYSRIFLKTDPAYRFIYDPGMIKAHTMPQGSQKISSRIRTFEEDTTYHVISSWEITNEKSFEGKNAVKLDKRQFTAGLSVWLKDVVPDSALWNRVWIRLKAKVFLPEENFDPTMAVSFRSDGTEYNWMGCPLFFSVNNNRTWDDFEYDVKLPPPPGGNVEICMFLIHSGESVAYADNMEMEFWVEP